MAQTVTLDPTLAYTKSEYAKAFGISRVTLDKRIRAREVKTVEVNGTVLILSERR